MASAQSIMALDVGDKRIGVAGLDPFGWTIQPLKTIERKDIKQTLNEIDKIICERSVEKIVIGLPLDLEGLEGPQAKKVRLFERQLVNFFKKKDKIEIVTWDESLTTKEVEVELIKRGFSRAKRKKIVDQMAAVLILESFLEATE